MTDTNNKQDRRTTRQSHDRQKPTDRTEATSARTRTRTRTRRSPPTCVRALVDLEVLAAGEDLPAAGEGAGEGLLPGVHAHVVHQLVLGLEGPPVPHAALPETRVVGLLRPAHVLHRDVRDDLVHGVEDLVAGLARLRLLLLHPQTRVLLLDGVTSEDRVEGPRVARVAHVHPARVAHVHGGEVLGRPEVVGARGRHLVELVGAGVAEHVVGVHGVGGGVVGGGGAVVQAGEEHVVGGVGLRMVVPVQPRRRREDARMGRRARLGGAHPEPHLRPPHQQVARVGRDLGVRVRHAVAVGLRGELVGLAVEPHAHAPGPVADGVGRAQLEGARGEMRRVRRLHEVIDHHRVVVQVRGRPSV